MNRLRATQQGLSMIEVLVTLVLLTVGLLGFATLESKLQVTQMESYQRAQAVLLVNDMAERMNSNYPNVSSYVTGTTTPLGVGNTTETTACTTLTGYSRDLCEWNLALQGAAETKTSGSTTTNMGAMIGARGCVELVQAANTTSGICTPGVYRITVTWQGLNKTAAPPTGLACASGLYGDETQRRAVSLQIAIGLSQCS
jgi:type IV pilus assembly protein PilV